MNNEKVLTEAVNAKKEGKRIGLVQGSWDMFHLGHLLYLKEARKLCDYLIVAMDDDEKIRKRKGNNRPIIPLEERYQFIENLGIADGIAVKSLSEPKWGLIKELQPDVLIAIKDNYTEDEIKRLEEHCGSVAILPRQSQSSTSDKIRKILISAGEEQSRSINERVTGIIEEMKTRTLTSNTDYEPLNLLYEGLKESTDWVCPVSVGCFYNNKWYYGTNQIDLHLPKCDIEKRTELFYATVLHAEIDLLKKLGDVDLSETQIWTTLFPCDKCMKVLNDRGIKTIYYLEDHPERNWSKRSHELAKKNGIKTISIPQMLNSKEDSLIALDGNQETAEYKYIDPNNIRSQEQLDIMLNLESQNLDPLDPEIINQEIILYSKYWYVSLNKFPYEGVQYQFLIAAIEPIYKIEDMPKEMLIDLKDMWLKLINNYKIPGGALCFRFGNTTYSGATLTRLHCHLISPKEGSKTRFSIGGRTYRKEFAQEQ